MKSAKMKRSKGYLSLWMTCPRRRGAIVDDAVHDGEKARGGDGGKGTGRGISLVFRTR